MLTEKLKAIAAEIEAAAEDGKLSFNEVCRVCGAIVVAAAETIKALDEPAENCPAIIAECEAFYDTTVAPYDIRMIPNWMEPMFDGMIRASIRPAITSVFDWCASK